MTCTGRAVARPRMDVGAVLRRGRRRHAPLVVAHVVDRGDGGPTRSAVVASRRVGGAVRRNRAKRLLRVASRALPPRGCDVVLVARAETPAARSHEVHAQVERMFDHERAPRG